MRFNARDAIGAAATFIRRNEHVATDARDACPGFHRSENDRIEEVLIRAEDLPSGSNASAANLAAYHAIVERST
jgi:hypothetical protein